MAYYITDIIRRYETDLQNVNRNVWALAGIKEQTPELCLAAVQKNGWALQYVKKQTNELCLEAVKQNGMALKSVRDLELKEKIKLERNL